MSTTINHSKSILLAFVCCLALLGSSGAIATAQEIKWSQTLDQAKAEAAKTNRLVWLHFAADWCSPCKKLETFVFNNSSVIRTSDRNVVAVKIDVDENDLLVRQLGVPRIPYDIVMTPEGQTLVSRSSPRTSVDYLKMFESLDAPLQTLNSGDRVSINAGINQVQQAVEKVGGFRQSKNDLDIDGPSHQMAATTVEGQRIERGISGTERSAEMRALKSKLLIQKAKVFMAKEEQRLSPSQGPKISDNPFFKGANVSASAASESGKDTAKVVSNQFVAKQVKAVPVKPVDNAPSFRPPPPPTITGKQVKSNVAEDLNQYDESQEFSFPGLASASDNAASKETGRQTAKAASPKFTLPKFSDSKIAELKQSLPAVPEFKDRSEDKSNDFAYAPIDELKKAIGATSKSESNQFKPVEQVVKKARENPLRSDLAGKTPAVEKSTASVSPKLQRPIAKRPTTSVTKPRFKTHTDVAVPQPPVMVEGVVKIAESMIPAVEGRLVAAEQPIKNDFRVRQQPASVEPPQQVMRRDQLLEQVNFFGVERPVQQPTQVTIVQAQPAPQPQVVINLNTGTAAQPASRNRGRIVQQGAVAQATATTAAGNRARIVSADIASAVRSKYALKGKCPVTLLAQGQWVDGKKEIGCVHRDRVYLFASAEHREAFLANPDQLSPLLAGFDPVIFEETGKLVEGEERFGTFMGDAPNQRIVLFKTADTRDRFQREPVKYINVVRSAMAKKAKKNTKLR